MKRLQQPDIERDRWKRPVINGKSYLRPSTLAKTLDDQSNLIEWSSAMTALGMSRSPDLIALASTIDPAEHRKARDIVKRAKDRVMSQGGADIGTAIHSATEAVDYGESIAHMPADLQADALAYRAARESLGLEPLAAEVFVVNEELEAAGTFDRLVQSWEDGDGFDGYAVHGPRPDGPPMVTDIKTGSKDDPEYAAKFGAVAWSIQLATYAYAQPYGSTWEDLGAYGSPRDTDGGVIWYIPRGTGKCYPIFVDIALGWDLAQTARKVYDARKANVVHSIHEAVTA